MRVGDLMKRELVSVSTNATLKKVKEKMLENNVDFVVIEEEKEIIGIITSTDLIAYMSAGKSLDELKACNCMTVCKLSGTNPCLQVFEDSPLEDAMKIVAVTGVHHLLVWGKRGHPAGVISSEDILKVVK